MSPRPAKTSRDQIVRAAVAMLDDVGPDAFSMRGLATGLGIDPMTLYHHLPSKSALLDAVLDELWGGVTLHAPSPGEGWAPVVTDLAYGLRRVLLDHPTLVAMVASRPATTPALLLTLDRVLGWLVQEGLAPADALRLLDCVVGYVIGKVQQEVRPPELGADLPPEELGLVAQTHPHLVSALASGYDWAPEHEFHLGLAAMLRGWVPDR